MTCPFHDMDGGEVVEAGAAGRPPADEDRGVDAVAVQVEEMSVTGGNAVMLFGIFLIHKSTSNSGQIFGLTWPDYGFENVLVNLHNFLKLNYVVSVKQESFDLNRFQKTNNVFVSLATQCFIC